MSPLISRMTEGRLWLFLLLIMAGAVWGGTIPASKIVISAGYPVFGILFWQSLLVAIVTGVISIAQGARLRLSRRTLVLMAWIGIFGTLIPNSIGFISINHLPAGVMAITISMVPIFVMPIAVALGKETFAFSRMLGVLFGAIAIFLLIGPEASLPDPSKSFFVLFALLATLCYAVEDNFIAYFGLDDHPAVLVLCGSMIFILCIITPLATIRGEMFLLGASGGTKAEFALILMSVMHAFAYATFIWLIGITGPVFTSLVAYLVTIFGVFWSIVFLNESYSGWIWAALCLMLLAMFLVRPRAQAG